MSMQHCFHCDKGIDTDFDAEHFEILESGKTLCQEESGSQLDDMMGNPLVTIDDLIKQAKVLKERKL